MKKNFLCIFLLVGSWALADENALSSSSPKIFMTDKSGLNWYVTGKEQISDDWIGAEDYCNSVGLDSPSIDQVESARDQLKQALNQNQIPNQCYWTRSHTDAYEGFEGYFFIFDDERLPAVFSIWSSNESSQGCNVRCVDR
jgi:hypothetical protein